MDALAEALTMSRTSGTVLLALHGQAPWSVLSPVSNGTAFHVVVEGSCWLMMGDDPPRQFVAGDVVVIPGGREHHLASDPTLSPGPLPFEGPEELVGVPEFGLPGGDGPVTRLHCGAFLRDPAVEHPVVGLLPDLIAVPAGALDDGPFGALVRLLCFETERGEPGASLAADRLADVLLVHVIRRWLSGDGAEQVSWLAALRDRDVAHALALVHARPEFPWTVESLALKTGMSRATLARRFTELVGEPPLAYLTRWRMEVAARRLRTTHDSLAVIARDAGYGSEAAFSRAFSRARGVPPGRYRTALANA